MLQTPFRQNKECFDVLHDSLDQIPKLEEFEIFLRGDLNISYGDDKSTLKTLVCKYSLTQLIILPTLITARTSTILDLILTNSKYVESCGTEEVRMSDHERSTPSIKACMVKISTVDFKCRCITNFIKDDFQNDLVSRNWLDFYHTEDVDDQWETLHEIIHKTADKHCLIKKFRGRKELP